MVRSSSDAGGGARRLGGLDSLRGLTALGVLVLHAWIFAWGDNGRAAARALGARPRRAAPRTSVLLRPQRISADRPVDRRRAGRSPAAEAGLVRRAPHRARRPRVHRRGHRLDLAAARHREPAHAAHRRALALLLLPAQLRTPNGRQAQPAAVVAGRRDDLLRRAADCRRAAPEAAHARPAARRSSRFSSWLPAVPTNCSSARDETQQNSLAAWFGYFALGGGAAVLDAQALVCPACR